MLRLFSRKPVETHSAVADETRSLAEPTAFDFAVFGAVPSLAGVTASTAMQVPAVAAGVKVLAEATSILPLPAYRRGEGASRERDNDHPAYRLLNLDANPWTRGPQLRELLTSDAIAHGNGFALIVRDGTGAPRELHRVHPAAVAIEIDRLTGEPRYRTTTEASRGLVSFMDIIHIRAPATTCMDAVSGVSPLMQARDAVGLLIVLQGHACRLFANGALRMSMRFDATEADEREVLANARAVLEVRLERLGFTAPVYIEEATAIMVETYTAELVRLAGGKAHV